jgi:uncharacterized LabA/DUF88 family protein
MPDHVALYLDYENVHRVGHGLYARGRERYTCVPEPSLIADLIATRRQQDTEITVIRAYRGLPNSRLEPEAASSNAQQANQWERRDSRVRVVRRPLAYRGWPDHPPVEKGIDVQIAVDMIQAAMGKVFAALILFTSDTDLLPAVELAGQVGTAVEVACWDGAKPLRASAVHHLTAADWRKVTRDWTGRV